MSSQTLAQFFALFTAALIGVFINHAINAWLARREKRLLASISQWPVVKGAPTPMQSPIRGRLMPKSVWKGKLLGEEVVVETVNEYVVCCTYLTNRSTSFVQSVYTFLHSYTFMAPDESYLKLSPRSAAAKSLVPSPIRSPTTLMELTGEQVLAMRELFGLNVATPQEQEAVSAQSAIDAAEEAFSDPAKKGMI